MPNGQLKVLFIFIELRLSKKITKRVWLAFAFKTSQNDRWKFSSFHWIATFEKDYQKGSACSCFENKPKSQLKVLFILLNCDFQKSSPKGSGWVGLWKQSQIYSWKSFSFSLNCDFQKKCESKTKKKAESSFHFRWIATFKKCH